MLLKSITLKNLLSFKETELELQPLNVLIGPNASGKSNLIEAIGLLQAAPTDLERAIAKGGGVREWIRKAGRGITEATIECRLVSDDLLGYTLTFAETASGMVIADEHLQNLSGEPPHELYLKRTSGSVAIALQPVDASRISPSGSMLAQFKSPVDSTPITSVGDAFQGIRIYKEFNTGPIAPARTGVPANSARGPLRNGGDNLALVLHDMDFRGTLHRVDKALRRFCAVFEKVKPRIVEGLAQTYTFETGMPDDPIPAIRLSDGTLKFLCLLAVLFDPEPASLTCIEEPESGLHPDALQIVADALVEASERTQLVVTTHSESLVSALSDQPEAVVVCERDFDNSTQFQRLSRTRLDEWLERYKLGDLWRKGEIGGNRW